MHFLHVEIPLSAETGKSHNVSEYTVLGLAGRCVSVTVHPQMSVNAN